MGRQGRNAVQEHEGSPVFTCAVARDGAMVTVTVTGEIDLASSPELRRMLHDQLEDEGVVTLVVDLEGVTFIDSSGLGVLVGVLKRVNEAPTERVLRVSGVHGAVRKVFEITGLDEVFTID